MLDVSRYDGIGRSFVQPLLANSGFSVWGFALWSSDFTLQASTGQDDPTGWFQKFLFSDT